MYSFVYKCCNLSKRHLILILTTSLKKKDKHTSVTIMMGNGLGITSGKDFVKRWIKIFQA